MNMMAHHVLDIIRVDFNELDIEARIAKRPLAYATPMSDYVREITFGGFPSWRRTFDWLEVTQPGDQTQSLRYFLPTLVGLSPHMAYEGSNTLALELYLDWLALYWNLRTDNGLWPEGVPPRVTDYVQDRFQESVLNWV